MKKILIILIIGLVLLNGCKPSEEEQKRVQEIEDLKFCNNLEIRIEPSISAVESGLGAGDIGVNYCFYSNVGTTAKSIITLVNGKKFEETENLREESCMMQQLTHVAGYRGSGYSGMINCDDVKSIELISERCPNVKDMVTNMNEITCGI